MTVNYQHLLDAELEKMKNGEGRKKVLLHSCCGPCSTYCIEYLTQFCDVTVFYYNPNVQPMEEYQHRLSEQKRLCEVLDVPVVEVGWEEECFLSAVKGFEQCEEGGARCEICFRLRLEKTAKAALSGGYDFFATTLTVSPHKNAPLINSIGFEVADRCGVSFLPSDFKKKGGYQRSIVLSKEYNLYRQDYCGCLFSIRENSGSAVTTCSRF